MLDMEQIGYFLYMEQQEKEQIAAENEKVNNDLYDYLEPEGISQSENEKQIYKYP